MIHKRLLVGCQVIVRDLLLLGEPIESLKHTTRRSRGWDKLDDVGLRLLQVVVPQVEVLNHLVSS